MQFPLTFHTSPVAQAGSTLEISLLLSVCGTVLKEEPFFLVIVYKMVPGEKLP